MLGVDKKQPRIARPERRVEFLDVLELVDAEEADGVTEPIPGEQVPDRDVEIEELRFDLADAEAAMKHVADSAACNAYFAAIDNPMDPDTAPKHFRVLREY